MEKIVTDKCEVCGSSPTVRNGKHGNNVCRHCSKRIDTWGIEGAKKLIELSRQSGDIDMDFAKKFCKENYAGKVTRSFERVAVMRISLRLLGYKGKVVGKHRQNNPNYANVRGANIAHHNRKGTKKDACEDCGERDELHLHHVIPASWGGIEIDPERVRTLCKSCHRKAHEKLKGALTRNLLIEFLRPHFGEIEKIVESVL